MTHIFNMFDLIVLGAMLISIIVGLIRGFTREFLGIAAWIGSIIIAILAMPYLKTFVKPYIKDDFIAAVVAGLVVFIIAFVLLGIISRHISIKVKSSILGGLDRTFGLLFGIARGALVLCLLFIFMSLVSHPSKWPPMVNESKSIPFIERGALYIQEATPERFYAAIGGKKKFQAHFSSHDVSAEHLVRDLSRPPAAVQKTDLPKDEQPKEKVETKIEPDKEKSKNNE